MHLIDTISEEQKHLLELASKNREEVFPRFQDNEDSYYITYADSRHLENAFLVYDSSEMRVFRENLERLFANTNYRQVIPVMMHAYWDCRDKEENQLSKVDLTNYMM